MPELSGARVPRRVPKLGHKKSMFGCQRCRARRVKCNEARPACHHCERHQLPCVYDRDGLLTERSNNTLNKSPSTTSTETSGEHESQKEGLPERSRVYFGAGAAGGRNEDDPPESRARRMLEARLMHQYVTETGRSIAIDEVSRDVFAKTIPELSFRSDALLYSMYTIAALHLARLDKDIGTSLEGVANRYFSMAIREHKREISQVGRDTVDVVCLTSCLMRNYATIQLQERSMQPYTPPWEWLAVTQSSTTVFEEAWRLVGEERNSVAFRLIKDTRHIHDKECRPPRPRDSSRRLGHLMDRSPGDGTAEPWDPDIQKAYESTLDYIGGVLDEIDRGGSSGNVCRMLVLFPMLAEKRYVELVTAGSPRALVILAHYFALLAKHDEFWWIGDSPTKEVLAIAGELSREWKRFMDWPLKMIMK